MYRFAFLLMVYECCPHLGHGHKKKATDKTSRDKTFARQNLLSKRFLTFFPGMNYSPYLVIFAVICHQHV